MNDQGLSIRELAKLGGISPDTIRQWVQRGLLPRVRFAGRGTRYPDAHLQRIRAIKRLKGEGLALVDIGARLATMTPQDIQGFLHPVPATPPPPPTPTFHAENWKRLVLCPGLELHIADTAVHKRMAQQVYEDFLARQTT
jgi:excisionase family DNA binding protein